ncbi:cytoplasmic protein [Shewanella intestini]|uniref:Cytoplasmic protein n=1 Tax=Shewanella intestini TaxID=2017544 RepID=A0ABS5I582_9GAMM|nr:MULTISPECIES: cytoplasmic protein [Shewanella]MBR9729182.1 cytoplasmic protein [Shewanella intestini]MRG37247.1 cytoplasmic protein [Shewanella sp. XMDDZSB0408]
MTISVNAPSSMPTNINSENSLKVAAMSNKQQKVEGDIAMKLINAAVPPPTGNSGHNINVKA